jgi:hypothetical protein
MQGIFARGLFSNDATDNILEEFSRNLSTELNFFIQLIVSKADNQLLPVQHSSQHTAARLAENLFEFT